MIVSLPTPSGSYDTKSPSNTYMAYAKVRDRKMKNKKLFFDLDIFTGPLGQPINLKADDISATQIVSDRPFASFSTTFYTDGVYRNLVDENKTLAQQSRYGIGSGYFDATKGKKITLFSPLFIQDVDHMNALINASIQTNIMYDTKNIDKERLNNLWSFVLLRVGDNSDVNLKGYKKGNGEFPSTYILRKLGYDGIIRSMDEYEFLPQCIAFGKVNENAEYAKYEY
jgi:hypothetical protein